MIEADVYMNTAPDSGRCYAVLTIRKNGSVVKTSPAYYIGGSNGRYGPISSPRYTNPSYRYNAVARVDVYDCNWNWHYYQVSPTLAGP